MTQQGMGRQVGEGAREMNTFKITKPERARSLSAVLDYPRKVNLDYTGPNGYYCLDLTSKEARELGEALIALSKELLTEQER